MNKLLKNKILSLTDLEPNIYIKGRHRINGFVKAAAEARNVVFTTKPVRKMIKTELFYEDEYIGGYTGMKPSTTSPTAFHLCKDKFKLENHLARVGISTFESEIFYEHEKEKARILINANKDTLYVLKPISLSGGKGIEFKVDTNDFEHAWKRCIDIQKEYGRKEIACILQPYKDGFDLRVTIIEGTYSSAIMRIPAHVIGNGKSTVMQLIDNKNLIRSSSEYFNNKLIQVNESLLKLLEVQSIGLDDVVQEDEVIQLSYVGNLIAGADSLDVTDEISDEIIRLAIEATAAVPGLYSAGIDIIAEDYCNGSGMIVEVNTNPNNRMHELPFRGERRSPAKDYINSLIINKKVKNKEELTSEERLINSQYQEFLKLKSDYYSKYFEVM